MAEWSYQEGVTVSLKNEWPHPADDSLKKKFKAANRRIKNLSVVSPVDDLIKGIHW